MAWLRRRTTWVWLARIFITLTILMMLALLGLARWLAVDLPSPNLLYERTATPSTQIYDRRGRLLYEILDPHRGAHTPTSLDDIPTACVNATIATEDASFYHNPGVDAWAIVRALWINLRGGEILSGGSTITQQLARNLLLSPEERTDISLERKLREAVLAWRLARKYEKDEILTLYLNETYYGNLAYGIESAAQTYFAKSVAELDLAECAMLAGLPQSPASYNPLENLEAAKARQSIVLKLMVKNDYISPQEADLAVSEKLSFASTPFPIKAPHFVMYIRGQLEKEFGLEAIYTQGLQVHTTLDLDAQGVAERAVGYRLGQLADTRGGQPPRNVRNAAVVVMDPQTGDVLAMVGSPDYFEARIDGAVNATTATRQPGSSIKPIAYAAAFDPNHTSPSTGSGRSALTAATMVMDVRTAFVTREGDPYVPQNYDHQWRGPVLLRQALASSYNLVAVKVLDYLGVEAMTELARAMGITTFDDVDRFGLALALGGGEVRLLELTAAYGAFANGGYRVEPVTITRVENSQGRTLKSRNATSRRRVMDERVAYLITDILSDNFARASTFGEGSPLRITRPAAAKTGTTTDWRDNWTVGYTPNLVVGVWAGNADNEPMRYVSGVMGAAPVWHDIMEALHKGHTAQEFVEPPGMVHVEVCADSGLLPWKSGRLEGWKGGRVEEREDESVSQSTNLTTSQSATLPTIQACPRTITELFIEGTEPTRVDDWHWLFTLDTRNGLLAGPGCPPQYTTQRLYTLYPAEAQDWVLKQGIPQPPEMYSPLCPDKASTDSQSLAVEGWKAGRLEDWKTGTITSRVPVGNDWMESDYPTIQPSNLPTFQLILTSPDEGSRYRLSPEIPKAMQQVAVTVRPVDDMVLDQVTLLADGRPLATLTRPPYHVLWPMTIGTHVFTAVGVDVEGNELQGNRVVVEIVE